MPLTEQQRHAVFHNDATQRITHTWSAVAQRNVFATSATLFVKLIRQDLVQLPIQDTLENIQSAPASRIMRIARYQVADRLEHGLAELNVVSSNVPGRAWRDVALAPQS